jgi:hypothetical protein
MEQTLRLGAAETRNAGSVEQAYRYPVDSWSEGDARKHCQAHDGRFEPATKKEGDSLNQERREGEPKTDKERFMEHYNLTDEQMHHACMLQRAFKDLKQLSCRQAQLVFSVLYKLTSVKSFDGLWCLGFRENARTAANPSSWPT